MNVSLTRKLEKMVNDMVASGMYHTASEVVRDGLRMLQDRDALRKAKLKQLKKEIDIGLRQSERGQSKVFDAAEFKRRIRAQLQAEPNGIQRKKSA